AHYRAGCLKCHDRPGDGVRGCSLPVGERRRTSPQDSCIDCHMPPYASSDIAHTASTDHRIVRRARPRAAQAPHAGPASCADFYRGALRRGGDPEAERSLGLGLVKMMNAGLLPSERYAEEALLLLESALADHAGDGELAQARVRVLLLLRRPSEALAAAEL